MKRDLSRLFDHYLVEINRYTNLLVKICEPLSDPEKCEVYESFVLKICATWEIFVEDLLALCLSQNASRYSEYMGAKLPKRPSKQMCTVLISGYRYLDFRRISELQSISKNILVDEYNPFPRMPKSDSRRLDEFFQIRNYVAHKSRVAERSLLRVYQMVYNIQRFQEPGGFLLSPLHKRSKEIRFGEYIRAFINAAKTMALYLRVYETNR